ncbi:MAG: Hsp70 family protein [Anaerolineae bacterium]
MFPSIGIDLGTVACRAAHLVGDEPRIILNRRQLADTPSCVGVAPSGQVVVGEQADALDTPPLIGVKQMLGSQRRVWFGGVMRTPAELAALLLRALREDAERLLGTPVASAVVSVPAAAGNLQRVALREAAAAAGLRSVRLLNEPTAAALSSISRQGAPRRLLVYSLGAGSFEAVIFEVEGRQFKSLAVAGQEGIGGAVFDAQLADYLLARLGAAPPRLSWQPDAGDLFRVRRRVEDAKIRLSEVTQTVVTLEQAIAGNKSTQLDIPLSRDELRTLVGPSVQATIRVVQKMLDDTRLTADDLDDVLLVGGSTRLCLVQESIGELTGKEGTLAPLDSVARGAALQTATLEEPAKLDTPPANPPARQPSTPPVERRPAHPPIPFSISKPRQAAAAPRSPSLVECLAWLDRGEFDRAIDGLRTLYRQHPTPQLRGCLSQAYYGKGLKLTETGKWSQAEKTLAEALGYNPADTATRNLLGQVCLTWANKVIENGDRPYGQQILQRGLGYNPGHAELAKRLQELKAAQRGKSAGKGKRNTKR